MGCCIEKMYSLIMFGGENFLLYGKFSYMGRLVIGCLVMGCLFIGGTLSDGTFCM